MVSIDLLCIMLRTKATSVQATYTQLIKASPVTYFLAGIPLFDSKVQFSSTPSSFLKQKIFNMSTFFLQGSLVYWVTNSSISVIQVTAAFPLLH